MCRNSKPDRYCSIRARTSTRVTLHQLTAPNPLTDGQISQLLQVLQGILAAIGNIDLSEVIGSGE